MLIIITVGAHLEIRELQWDGWDGIKYFPYYLIGYLLNREKKNLENISSKTPRILSLFIISATFFMLLIFEVSFSEIMTDAADSNNISSIPLLIKKYNFSESFPRDMIFRICSAILAFCIFSLMPRKKTIFTKLGQNSLYAYLLHIFFIPIIEKSGLYKHSNPLFLLALLYSKTLTQFSEQSHFLSKLWGYFHLQLSDALLFSTIYCCFFN